jgi:hypothetical protein
MDVCPTPEVAAVEALQSMLASITVQLDWLLPHLPPLECTWQGTARAAYRINLELMSSGFALLQQHIADATSAATRALGEV